VQSDSSQRSVADELAIRDLVARYADAVAQRDSQAWADTWADDASWILGPTSRADGRKEIVRTWTRLMDSFEFVIQIPEYGSVEVQDGQAFGRWTIRELGWPKQGDPTATLGLYRDAYRCDEGTWRFSERRFQFVYMGPPDLSGKLFGLPSAAAEHSDRERSG
jgi:uncharacterized protein (TIGR02246 family)